MWGAAPNAGLGFGESFNQSPINSLPFLPELYSLFVSLCTMQTGKDIELQRLVGIIGS